MSERPINEQLVLEGLQQMVDEPSFIEWLENEQLSDSSTVGFALAALIEHERKHGTLWGKQEQPEV